MNQGLLKRLEEAGRSRREAAPEETILARAAVGDWKQVEELLAALGRPMDEGAAELCLEYGLKNASSQVFDRLLDKLPQRETTGQAVVKVCGTDTYVEVEGTLVTIAAAQGRTDHLQSLLSHGWDVNSASLDAVWRLKRHFGMKEPWFHYKAKPCASCTARPESQLKVLPNMEEGFPLSVSQNFFCGITPLAAAIFCGQTDCVRVLLEQEGV